MKKCGESFAHPLCLLLDSGAIVGSYGQFDFEEIGTEKYSARHKCGECGISSTNVVVCGSKGCQKKCHIYCAYKGG